MAQADKFEEYNKVRVLGQGAFGKAILVQHKQTNEFWVMKQLDLSAMPQKEKEITIKEAKILQMLNHPNIVQFKDVYITAKNKLCIIMEYADGGDLAQKLKDQKGQPLSENQILDWFTQICLALKHVHDRKILHRDLKGQNIFLTKKNCIKLGDFGIARVLQSTLEKARTQVGTPYYLSPEIIESKPYSYASDIWSLGAILYEMCSLKPPFLADSLHLLALKILSGQYPPIPNQYSKDLKMLIQQLLQKQFLKRPSINQVLKQPIIVRRINEFLTESVQKVEFAHTILHKQRLHINVNLNDIKVVEEDLPRPPVLYQQKQLSVPNLNQNQPQIVKQQSQQQQAQKQGHQQYQYQQQKQFPSHQGQQHTPQHAQQQIKQQAKNSPIQIPQQQQQQQQRNVKPINQVGKVTKPTVHKPTTAQNFNKRSNSKNRQEIEQRQKDEQQLQKYKQIKQEAEKKRLEKEKKDQQILQQKRDDEKKKKEEQKKKQIQLSEEMKKDLQRRRQEKQQQQIKSMPEQFQTVQDKDSGSVQCSNQAQQDLEEYNSEEEDEIIAKQASYQGARSQPELDENNDNNQEHEQEQDEEIEQILSDEEENQQHNNNNIEQHNDKYNKDDIKEAEMLLDLEDVVKDVQEALNKVKELDDFEQKRQLILQQDLVAEVTRDDEEEEETHDLTLSKTNFVDAKEDDVGFQCLGNPDALTFMKDYLYKCIGAENTEKALQILENELLTKSLEQVEIENNKNCYQTLLPFLTTEQVKSNINLLLQYIIQKDQFD